MYSVGRCTGEKANIDFLWLFPFVFWILGFDIQQSSKVYANVCGKLVGGKALNGEPSCLWQSTQLEIIFFTTSCQRSTHYHSHKVVKVSLIPLCLTVSCDCLINKWVNSCFAGIRTGFLVFTGNDVLFSLLWHLIISSSKYNPNLVTYVGGVELWSLLRRKAISLEKDDVLTDLVHRFSASFKSVAVNLIRTLFVGDLILERFSCLGYESKYMRNVIIAVV